MNTRKKKRKRRADRVDKYLLETSAQIVRLTPSPEKQDVDYLLQKGSIYSSYFVLYEFKTGLIRNILEYYFLAKSASTPAEAMAVWSNKWGIREVKNKVLLEAKMAQLFRSVDASDTRKYLGQIQAVVFDLVTNFETGLVSLVGDFGPDPIVKAELLTEDDYKNFLALYGSRKFVPLQKFWEKHIAELRKITAESEKMTANEALSRIHKYLVEIGGDITKADRHNHSKGVSDAVIAVDMPRCMVLTTLDRAFETICPLLNKRCRLVQRRKVQDQLLRLES